MSSHPLGRTVRLRLAVLAVFLVAAVAACSGRQEEAPSAEVSDPMASFARLVPGEWRVTARSGKSMFHTWHWGPGKHSIRRMTDGAGAGGEPWRALLVAYWHPGRKEVRVFGLDPFARGVTDGAIRFDGEAADAVFDLYQTGGRRKMALRWAFDGPDKYHETLSEAVGPAGFEPLVEFDPVRVQPPATPRPRTVEGAKPSEHLKSLEPLLGRTWEAKGEWAAAGGIHSQTTFEWVPLADAVYARVTAPTQGGEPTHLLDVYVYHHTGAGVHRCLALSERGGVYEGDLAVLDGGALQLDLKGDEEGRVVPYVARFDFEPAGVVRQRVWSVKGTQRALLLNVQHKEVDSMEE